MITLLTFYKHFFTFFLVCVQGTIKPTICLVLVPERHCLNLLVCQSDDKDKMKTLNLFSSGSVVWNWSTELISLNLQNFKLVALFVVALKALKHRWAKRQNFWACLKRRHVYVAVWPSGRAAEIKPYFL